MHNIFAVLLNYNDGEDIIRSVRKLSSFKSVKKIIVVDNGSTDSSLAEITERKSPKLVILKNGKNLGFGKGCNVGIKYALRHGADGIANLNPDLDYSFDFIAALAKDAGDLLCPVLKFRKDGKAVYDFGGKINWPLGKTYHLESSPKKNLFIGITPDFASGGAVLIKKEVFGKIGYFDERFFIYFEDADFSLRAKAAGFKVFVDDSVVIEHKLEIHKTSKNWRKIKNNAIANFRFIAKCVPWYFKPTAYLYLLLVSVKIGINFLVK